MEEQLKLKCFLYFTVLYLFIFTVISLINKNYEFFYYIVIMVLILLLIMLYHKQMHLSSILVIGLTIIGLMHMSGGNTFIGGIRLYDVWIIKGIFRYDNLVHFIGVFVATLVAYNMLNPHLDKKIRGNRFMLFLLFVFLGFALGALNEVFEFGSVVFLGASEAVGDYMNNALDLLYNLFGAIVASLFLIWYHKRIIK